MRRTAAMKAASSSMDAGTTDAAPGEKGVEPDRGQDGLPAENPGRSVGGQENALALLRVVPFDRGRDARAGAGRGNAFHHPE